MACEFDPTDVPFECIEARQEALLYGRYRLLESLEEVDAELQAYGLHVGSSDPVADDGGGVRKPGAPIVGTGSEGSIVGLPPAVIRGTNPHKAHVGIDWLRLSGPNSVQYLVRQILSAYYQAEPVAGPGLFLYGCAWVWHGGVVRMCYDKEDEVERHRNRFTVEIPGSGLCFMSADRRVELLRDLLQAGMKATRIDVALDVVGDGAETVFLVDLVHESCQRKELVHARKWRPIIERTNQGKLTGATVYMGKRGSAGSGRMVRCYDKGLETTGGKGLVNWWHRWEAEFSHETAETVACSIAGSIDWACDALTACLGAVDFKTVTGARDSCRRPRAEWWASFVTMCLDRAKAEPVGVRAARRLPSLAGQRRWLARNVLPMLSLMAREADCTVADILNQIPVARSAQGDKRRQNGLVMAEFREELDHGAAFEFAA